MRKSDVSIIRMLDCAICVCRKPHLGLLLLEGLDREAVCQKSLSVVARRDLAALVVAIADGVFGSDKTRQVTYEQDHKQWTASFIEKAPKATAACPCIPDKATDLEAWKRLICALLNFIGNALPQRIIESLPREREYTLGMLQIAVRLSEHDIFFLREVLNRQHWAAPVLSEAYTEALDPNQGVRGPNLTVVLGMLYETQLLEWRSNPTRRSKGTVTSTDDLAKPWATIVSSAQGYMEIDVDSGHTICVPSRMLREKEPSPPPPPPLPCDVRKFFKNGHKYAHEQEQQQQQQQSQQADNLEDPGAWIEIIEAMIRAHDPQQQQPQRAAHGYHGDAIFCDPAPHEWDLSSPLFASLIKIALRACVGHKQKTHLVEFFLNLSLQHSRAESDTLLHELPRIVSDVARDHPEVFPLLIKSMLTDAPPAALSANIDRFHDALLAAIDKRERESARMIVNALKPSSRRILFPSNSGAVRRRRITPTFASPSSCVGCATSGPARPRPNARSTAPTTPRSSTPAWSRTSSRSRAPTGRRRQKPTHWSTRATPTRRRGPGAAVRHGTKVPDNLAIRG